MKLNFEDYKNLIRSTKLKKGFDLSKMLKKPATGRLSRRSINQRIKKMRNEWE